MSMLVALPGMIPANIVKLYLINNSLSDDLHQDLYSTLQITKGLKTLVVS
jgi:Ran GTPase-activating protein (RanGAP) involved in mRNA processing and transport